MRQISKGLRWMAFSVFLLCFLLVVAEGIQGMQKNIETLNQADRVPIKQAEAFKTLRQQFRSMEKAQLNDIAHDTGSEPELAQMARRELIELCEREEQELTLEGILSMRGYLDPVVTVHSDSVNVILTTSTLNREESAVILDHVCRETGVQSGNIKIIPIN